MKTRAVRLYGAKDLRLEEFDLPEIKDDEILAKVYTDSICMSTYKAAILGTKHKRVPADVGVNPVIVGHEFSGMIVKTGAKWKDRFKPGQKFALQPALNYKGLPYSPGYSYAYCGGDATYIIFPNEVMEQGCLLEYNGEAYYEASLAEPMSCIIGAFHGMYHTTPGKHQHNMGIVENGKLALLAAAGPMGLGAIDYALHRDRKPSMIVVTDINEKRLERARTLFPPEKAARDGIKLIFVNTKGMDAARELRNITGNTGFDDVIVFAPVKEVVQLADKILGTDGCLSFFAGPTDNEFSAEINFYNVHYSSVHVLGTTGGNTDDMKEALAMSMQKRINPAVMITHIGGLDCVTDTILNLPNIPGGKKLIYTNIDMELTAIDEFEKKGERDPLFARLSEIIKSHNGLWCAEAENVLLAGLRQS